MKISKIIQDFLMNESVERFLSYVKIWSTSDEKSNRLPSTENQLVFGKVLIEEIKALGLQNVIQDKFGYIYADIIPSKGYENVRPIGLIAHLDTSPAVSGKDVKPVIHRDFNGQDIHFEQNKELLLSINDSPPLKDYIGLDIITSQGDTLLGADDKAGIAEIMTVCAAWNRFPELIHGPIKVCFTPDEEIGRGTYKIDTTKLPKVCYTLDGSEMGQLETECFDAWSTSIKFKGLNMHPGYAKNLMINAIHIASRFIAELPEYESPEHTENREGFYHLRELRGYEEEAIANLILRDFELSKNQTKMKYLEQLKNIYEIKYPGLKIDLNFQHQYENMIDFLKKEPKAIELAKKAIELAGLNVKMHSIRGGTDGAQLSAKGIPTPNIFAGGLLFHSKKEYIPIIALQKAAEVIIILADLWTKT